MLFHISKDTSFLVQEKTFKWWQEGGGAVIMRKQENKHAL